MESHGKKKKESIENVFGEPKGTLNEIKKSLSNDGTSALIQFLKEDSEKQSKRHVLEPNESNGAKPFNAQNGIVSSMLS